MTRDISFSLSLLLGFLTLFACSNAEDRMLVESSSDGNLQLVKTSLAKASNINVTANDGWTALTISAREGHFDVVEYLLNHGANINTPESGGNSPLFWAAFGGHVKVVKLLLDRGADTTRKCSRPSCQMPIEIAKARGHQEVVKVLLASK